MPATLRSGAFHKVTSHYSVKLYPLCDKAADRESVKYPIKLHLLTTRSFRYKRNDESHSFRNVTRSTQNRPRGTMSKSKYLAIRTNAARILVCGSGKRHTCQNKTFRQSTADSSQDREYTGLPPVDNHIPAMKCCYNRGVQLTPITK